MDSTTTSFSTEYRNEIINIRTQVFVVEQGIDPKLDFDGLDEVATHVVVYVQSKAIATGRLLNNGHIGRIAVLKDNRSNGAGTAILHALVKEAEKRGFSRVYLGSQIQAVGFYKKLGFKTCSEIFIDAGIDHVEMEFLL